MRAGEITIKDILYAGTGQLIYEKYLQPADQYTKLLLHGEGDVESTNVKDASGNNKIVTVNGDARISSHSKKFDIDGKFGTGVRFNGKNSYLSSPDSTDWSFGTGDFTIDFWINFDSFTMPDSYFYLLGQNADSNNYWIVFMDSSKKLEIYFKSGGVIKGFYATGSLTLSVNTWYHFSLERYGTTCKIFVDGVSQSVTENNAFSTNDVGDISAVLTIGQFASSGYFNGYIDELRISKGIARWINNFTPETSEYGKMDSYTKCLFHFDEIDGSTTINEASSGKTVTVNGNAKVSQVAGSLLLDGDSDYISLADSDDWYFGTGDFTIDCWVRFNSLPAESQIIIMQEEDSNNRWYIYRTSTNTLRVVFKSGGVQKAEYYTGILSLSTGVWYHIAVVRNGTSILIFLDGISQTLTEATAISTNDVGNINGLLYIGRYGLTSNYYFNGWIDELRISKGIARWTSNFTPPTSIYSTDSYTKCLLHFDGAYGWTTITEDSGKTVTVAGTAQLDTAQYKFTLIDYQKFGRNACAFDGSGDYLSLDDSDDWYFGTGDFTIDFWIKWNNKSGSQWIYSQRPDGSNRVDIYSDGSSLHFTSYNGGVALANYNFSFNPINHTWYHIAVVRSGSNFYIFKDGVSQTLNVSQAIGTNSLPNLANILTIGKPSNVADYYFKGWLDEFRVSKGIARWTSNFSVATKPYYDDYMDKLLLHFNGGLLNDVSFSPPNRVTVNNKCDLVGNACKFDTSKYITAPDNADWSFGTGDFTIETWINFTSLSGTQFIACQYADANNRWYILKDTPANGNKIEFDFWTGGVNKGHYIMSSAWSAQINTWYHIAIVRYGATAKLFINGVSQTLTETLAFSSNDVGDVSSVLYIGYYNGGYYALGYMDEYRISKGIARYTSNFTPSTIPFTYDSYTKLLLHFDDNYNDAGNTGHTITNYKTMFGANKIDSGCIAFDGTGDYLSLADSEDWDFGGDLTIECWAKIDAIQSANNSPIIGNSNNGANPIGWYMFFSSSGGSTYGGCGVRFYVATSAGSWAIQLDTDNWIIQQGVWYHIAVVRNGSAWTMYINGQVKATTTSSASITSSGALYLGYESTAGLVLNGCVDEVRISKGVARYTSEFTPSITAFTGDDPLTSLSITGLNGDEDEEYKLIIRQIGGSSVESYLYLFPNGEILNTKGLQQLYGTNTTVTAWRGLSSIWYLTGASGCDRGNISFIDSNILAKKGAIRKGLSQSVEDINGTTIQSINLQAQCWNNLVDNLTSLTITASQTNGIGTGSHILIFVRRKNGLDALTGFRTGDLEVKGKLNAGVMQKIYELDVTTAQTSVTISNLDGDTDTIYLIKIYQTNLSTGDLYIRLNNDSTSGIYGMQRLVGSGGGITASRGTLAHIATSWCDTSGYSGASQLIIYAKKGFNRTVIQNSMGNINGTDVGGLVFRGDVWNNAVDNITSLVLLSLTTNGIGVGTHIEVYALRRKI
jgi:hypothetical protein